MDVLRYSVKLAQSSPLLLHFRRRLAEGESRLLVEFIC